MTLLLMILKWFYDVILWISKLIRNRYFLYDITTLIHMYPNALHYVRLSLRALLYSTKPWPVQIALPSSFSLTHKEQTLCRYMSDRFSRRVLPTSYYRTFLVERDEAILHFDRLICLISPLRHQIWSWMQFVCFPINSEIN